MFIQRSAVRYTARAVPRKTPQMLRTRGRAVLRGQTPPGRQARMCRRRLLLWQAYDSNEVNEDVQNASNTPDSITDIAWPPYGLDGQ